MTSDEFAAWLAKEALSRWKGGPGTAMAWAQEEVNAWYLSKSEGEVPLVSIAMTAEALVFEGWARSDIKMYGRVSDALADELLPRLGDWACDYFARGLVYRAATEGWPLPRALRSFVNDNLGGRARRMGKGERSWKFSARNQMGAKILAVLTVGFGLHATRNVETKRLDSACDILAEATSGANWAAFTYNSAAEVWRERSRLWKELEVMHRTALFYNPSLPLIGPIARKLLAEIDAARNPP